MLDDLSERDAGYILIVFSIIGITYFSLAIKGKIKYNKKLSFICLVASLITLAFTVLALFGVIPSSNTKYPHDFGVNEFAERKVTNPAIIIGKITKVDYKFYSPRHKEVVVLHIGEIEIIHPKKSSNFNDLSCSFDRYHPLIATFQLQQFHEPLNLYPDETVFLYVGISSDGCEISHVSKIDDGILHFPKYQDHPAIDIRKSDIETIWSSLLKRTQ